MRYRLEAERCLQIDAAHGRTRGKRASLQTVRLIKVWRTKNAAGIPQIYLVEDVAYVETKGEIVAPVGRRAAHHRTTAEQWAVMVAPTGTTARARSRRFLDFRSKSNGFGKPEIQHGVRGAVSVIDGC